MSERILFFSRQRSVGYRLSMTSPFIVSRESTGLAGNDVWAFYPVLAFVLCLLYFGSNRQMVVGDYYQAVEEFEQSHDIKVVAQLGLRFFTRIAGEMGVFNEASPEERDRRESSLVEFVRSSVTQRETMKVRTEIVSQAARSKDSQTPQQKAGVHNTDCEKDFPQVSWWKAKYTFDRADGAATLPLSFFLEGTARNGAPVRLFGPVRSMELEADRDVTGSAPVDSIAWKMYVELEDRNWAQEGGVEGTLFRFVCTQQTDKCVFSALVRDNGSPLDVFVSQFALHLHTEPVRPTDDVLSLFLRDVPSLSPGRPPEGVLASFRAHSTRDLLLSYMVRALPEIDASVVFSREGEVLLVGGATSDTPLPLEVHLRSTEELNDSGDKFLALPVFRVMVRYVNPDPPQPGSLVPNGAAIKAVQFLLPNNHILAQDATKKSAWVVGDVTLHQNTTVDLLVLNKTPVVGGKTRVAGLGSGAKQSEVGGRVWFENFSGVRQGFASISVSKWEQDRLRGSETRVEDTPALAMMTAAVGATGPQCQNWNDLRVEREQVFAGAAPGKWFSETYLRDRRVLALFSGFALALVFGWKLATTRLAASAYGLVSLGLAATAVLSMCSALAEYLDRLPTSLRPYEPVLYIASCAMLALAMMANIVATRLLPETPATFLVSLALAALAAVGVIALEWKSPEPPPATVLSLKVALLATLGASLALLCLETFKLSRKAADMAAKDEQPPAASANIGHMPNLAALFTMMVFLGATAALLYIQRDDPPDGCAKPAAKLARLAENNAGTSKQEQQQRRMERETADCLARSKLASLRIFTEPRWSDLGAIVLAVLPIALLGAAPFSAMFISKLSPSRVSAETGEGRVLRLEDGRSPRSHWVVKTALGLFFLLSVVQFLLPHWPSANPYCAHLRNMEAVNRDRARSDIIGANTRMTQIFESEWRYGCVPRETLATSVVLLGVAVMAALSFVTPARKRFAPTRATALSTILRVLFFAGLTSLLAFVFLVPHNTILRSLWP